MNHFIRSLELSYRIGSQARGCDGGRVVGRETCAGGKGNTIDPMYGLWEEFCEFRQLYKVHVFQRYIRG